MENTNRRGPSALGFINENGLKIVGITNLFSRSGRVLPHSHKFICEDGRGRLWVVLESYESLVGLTNYFASTTTYINAETVWSSTTKRAFGVKISDVRANGRTLEEIVKILTNEE